MPRFLKPLLITLSLAAALLAFGVSPAGAGKPKTACWKTLLNDEFDGRIDNTYPVHCYREALKHLQVDVRDYGSAYSDINRALQSAIVSMTGKGGGPPGPNALVPGHPGKSKVHRSFFQWIADKIGPGNATSIPLPLLILAGLGLLLIAAAGASYAAKRIQARRAHPHPATNPPSPPRK